MKRFELSDSYAPDSSVREERSDHPMPHELAAARLCARRYWYMVRGLKLWKETNPKEHLPRRLGKAWRYEVELPSGAKLDGWHTGQQIAVEYKTTQPREAHLLQALAYSAELEQVLGRGAFQMQLWYPHFMHEPLEELATRLGLSWGINEDHFAAAALPADIDYWQDELNDILERMNAIRSALHPRTGWRSQIRYAGIVYCSIYVNFKFVWL